MNFKKAKLLFGLLAPHCLAFQAMAQRPEPIRFTVSMMNPGSHTFQVTMDWEASGKDSTRLFTILML